MANVSYVMERNIPNKHHPQFEEEELKAEAKRIAMEDDLRQEEIPDKIKLHTTAYNAALNKILEVEENGPSFEPKPSKKATKNK